MTTHLILWRIPRTASSSIVWGIVDAGVTHMIGRDWDRSKSGLVSFGHHTPDEVVAHGYATREELRDTPSLTVVRNPWNRLVSLFHEYRQRGGPGLQAIAAKYAPTFCDYVEWCVAGERHEGQHENYFQARPQTDWLPKPGQERENGCVFTFSQLPLAWQHVKRFFPDVGILPRINHSDHMHYREYYTPADREKVARYYAEEIERFGFQF